MSEPTLRDLFAELQFRLRGGPLRTWRWISDRLTDRLSDRRFGIDSSPAPTGEAPFPSPDFVRYQPVSYRDMQEILDDLPIRREDVFLDLGCGMGRALNLAATKPFRRVLGVEISPALCALARRNIERNRARLLCQDIQIIQADAASFQIPHDVTIVFLFNPFGGEILRNVIANVAASVETAPRPLHLVFCGTLSVPAFRREAGRHTVLHLQSEKRLRTGALVLTYRSSPAPDHH